MDRTLSRQGVLSVTLNLDYRFHPALGAEWGLFRVNNYHGSHVQLMIRVVSTNLTFIAWLKLPHCSQSQPENDISPLSSARKDISNDLDKATIWTLKQREKSGGRSSPRNYR